MAGSGIVGCSVSEAASSLADYGNRNAGGSTETEGREIGPNGQLLPPGVKAPEEPAQPGAAKLRPDGHYDYSAPDFVLGDPCEDPELMSRLAEQGWELGNGRLSKFSRPFDAGCTLTKSPEFTESIILLALRSNTKDLVRNGAVLQASDTKTDDALVFDKDTGHDNLCFKGNETQYGMVGLAYRYSEFTRFSSTTTACTYISEQFGSTIGGLS